MPYGAQHQLKKSKSIIKSLSKAREVEEARNSQLECDLSSLDSQKEVEVSQLELKICELMKNNERNELIGIRARNVNPDATAKYIPYKDINWRNGDNGWYKFITPDPE